MQILKTYITIILLTAYTFAYGLAKETYTLITSKTEYVAGSNIVLEFSTTTNTTPLLYVSNSFGSTVITPSNTLDKLSYPIPETITNKSGIVYWRLLTKTEELQGQFNIIPQQNVTTIQTYLGPPSIAAGGTDFSMLVAIPIDIYDNPLAENTKVAVKHQFLDTQQIDTISIKNSISYKNIFSPLKTGRMLMGSSCLGFDSKEYTVNIMPTTPIDFEISYQRHHEFADGNQITTLSTSIIKDEFQNIASDGTYVEFFLTTANQNILKTSGTTINGIVTARIIHPDHADKWFIQAFIEGMAKSNKINIEYKAVISDFDIELSNANRKITVGPLKSFMNQMIPDGLQVTLQIYRSNTIVETLRKTSADGYVQFELKPNQFPKGNYSITVQAAGISKSVKNITL
ncbi:hypothetical protein [uncultured Algibacter sp.]|uniref:hypothetical protein n=1 Tax=uncultured Algibacter sp. TaxID=298659 RepID=UPI002639E2A1|nr:hypothetical protein [uncultured Algibacter sp.]